MCHAAIQAKYPATCRAMAWRFSWIECHRIFFHYAPQPQRVGGVPIFNMKNRLLPFLPLLGAALLLPGGLAAEDSPSKQCALYYELHTRDHDDKSVSLDVAAVRPIPLDLGIEELKFFHVVTWDKRNDRFGGALVAAVPSAEAEKFVDRYGIYPEGGKPLRYGPKTRRLSGILRVDEASRMLLDVEGGAETLLEDRELPPRLWADAPFDGLGGRRGGPR